MIRSSCVRKLALQLRYRVAAADDVGLDILESQSLFGDFFDEVTEPVVLDVAHAVGGCVEINPVDDPVEQLVVLGNFTEPKGHLLANLAGELANDRPNRLVRIVGHKRQVEADEFIVLGHQLECFGPRTNLLGDTVDFVVKNVAEPFGKDQWKDEVLVFRWVLQNEPFSGFEPLARQFLSNPLLSDPP